MGGGSWLEEAGAEGRGAHLRDSWPCRRLPGFWNALNSSAELELQCTSRSLGPGELLRWRSDGTLEHVASGRYLFVDSQDPGRIRLNAVEGSSWEALPAL